MRKFNLSIHTKKELSKQQQSKIKGGFIAPVCSYACPTVACGNTKDYMVDEGGVA